jgi:hypothetical protein
MTSRQSATSEIAKKTKALLKKQVTDLAKSQPTQEPTSESNGLHDHIAARAYALYEEQGYRHGCDLQDWLDAEREILSHQQPV